MAITITTPDIDTDDTTVNLAALTPTDNGVIIGNGTAFVVENGATLRTSLGLAIGTDVQAYDADLTTWAGITPGIGWSTALAASANSTTTRTALGLAIGTDVQAYDADLSTWAGVTPGTGVATALAVNVGTAGAFVVNGGALGTPSSGTLTNATGLPVSTGLSGAGADWLDLLVADSPHMDPAAYGIAINDTGDNTTALQAFFNEAAARGAVVGCNDRDAIIRFASTIDIPSGLRSDGTRLTFHYTGTATGFELQGSDISLRGWRLYGDALIPISTISKANPGSVVTSSAHGFSTSDVGVIWTPEDGTGMAELRGRRFTATVSNTTTLTVGINTSAYTTHTTANLIKYRANHIGVFGQLTTFSPTVVTWFDNIDLSDMEIWGFGDTGVRIDWVRNARYNGIYVHDCAFAGVLSLSAQGVSMIAPRLERFGPGTSSVSYPVSFSRSYVSPALTTADAPESSNIEIVGATIKDNPHYVALDVHGAKNVKISSTIARNCHIGVNLEHATGGGSTVPPLDIAVTDLDTEGPSPTYFDIGPAVAVDGWATTGVEVQKGIVINGVKARRHGFDNTNGGAVFSNSGVIHVVESNGVIVSNVAARDCYKRVVYAGANAKGTVINGITDYDLVASGGIQDTVGVLASTADVTVDNMYISRSAGSAVQTSWNNLSLGANIRLTGGVDIMDASTRSVVALGPGKTAPLVQLALNGANGASPIIIWQSQLFKDWGVTAARNSTGDYTVTIPSGVFNSARINAQVSAENIYNVEIVNQSATTLQFRTYDNTITLADAFDISVSLQGQ